MNYGEFMKYIIDNVKSYLPGEYQDSSVQIQTVVKNNNQRFDGLLIKRPDSNICPTIYLNKYFSEYDEGGRSIKDILNEIANIRTNAELNGFFNIDSFKDWNSVKDHIGVRLVSAEQNEEYIADKPHMMVTDDLVAIYHVELRDFEAGMASVPITNSLLEDYNGIDVETLHQVALDNMESLNPATFKGMSEVMAELIGEGAELFMPPSGKEQMYVLSNKHGLFGAAVLLNNKVMDDVISKIGSDFYILPSSVHEVLIVPKVNGVDSEMLTQMVKEVNLSAVSSEEQLSNHVFTYDAKERTIIRADKAMEREDARKPSLDEQLDEANEMVKKQSEQKKAKALENERN